MNPAADTTGNIRILLFAFVVPFMLLLLHAFYYYPFFADDAFISLRYAERLLQGKGLNWNDGEYVEGYSNLLWVLATAFLGLMDMDLVAAGRVVGLVASGAAMYGFCHFHLRRYRDIHSLSISNIAFALTAPVAIWAIGGLEASLTMALLAWAFILAHDVIEKADKRKAFLTGIMLGGVCLCRPEGPVFTIAVAAAILVVARQHGWRPLLSCLFIMCATAFVFYASQLAFRLYYYNDWVPNTFYVKVAFTESRLINGLMYCLKGLASLLPLILIAAMKLDVLLKNPQYRAEKRSFAFLSLVCAIWVTILAIGGGDIFPGYRHLLLIVPAIMLMMMQSLVVLYSKGRVATSHLFIGYVLCCFVWLQVVFEENQKAREEQWVWDTSHLAMTLRTQYGDRQPLVAVTLAGVIPYYSKLPSIDMYGLNDAYITKHRHEDSGYGKFGEGFIGHELFNSKYVLSRRPDIIIFHDGRKPPLYGMGKEPEFVNHYVSRKIQLPNYTAEIWLRRDSEKLR